MNDYREVRLNLQPCSEDATDLLAQLLADIGYESFVSDAQGVTAYIPEKTYDRAALEEVLEDFPFECDITISDTKIEGQDWNSEWEKNYFKPIDVNGKVVVHSSFHTDVPQAPIDIVIDPKMAFGTGHHSTTFLVINQILEVDPKGLDVVDMGTGSGILAILCSKLGSREITAIEIDEFAFENTKENVALNDCKNIRLICGDATALVDVKPVDLFIANINRNVITADIGVYAKTLKAGGTMILSGFYEHDIPVVMESASPLGLMEVTHNTRENWTVLQLRKNT